MDAPGSVYELFILGPENHHLEENDDNFAGELEDLIVSDDDQESNILQMDGQQNTFLDDTLRPEEISRINIMDLDRQQDVLPQENCDGPVVVKQWQLDADVKWCANKVWSCSSSRDCYNFEIERPHPASTSEPLSESMTAMEQISQSNESESCSMNSAGCKKKPSSLKIRLAQARSKSKSKRPPTSKYKGVHRHVRSENLPAIWEAHCWNPFRSLKRMGNEDRGKNGAQEYLGQYLIEEEAAMAHDKAAIKLGLHLPENAKEGKVYQINFPMETYATDIAAHPDWSVSDYMWSLRRWAYGFTKGGSRFKGMSKREAKWEARFGRIDKNKVKREYYLGLHEKEEEAARAYDMAVLHFKGWDSHKLLTNFRPGFYDMQDVASFGKKLEEKNP